MQQAKQFCEGSLQQNRPTSRSKKNFNLHLKELQKNIQSPKSAERRNKDQKQNRDQKKKKNQYAKSQLFFKRKLTSLYPGSLRKQNPNERNRRGEIRTSITDKKNYMQENKNNYMPKGKPSRNIHFQKCTIFQE